MSKVPYKPTSNGEALSGNPVPRCSDELQNGVETCVTPQRMAPADKHGVHAGEVPAELNGGRVDGGPARDRARGRDGIVRTFGKPENQQLASGKSDLDSPRQNIKCEANIARLDTGPNAATLATTQGAG